MGVSFIQIAKKQNRLIKIKFDIIEYSKSTGVIVVDKSDPFLAMLKVGRIYVVFDVGVRRGIVINHKLLFYFDYAKFQQNQSFLIQNIKKQKILKHIIQSKKRKT
eukprot:TRINITY_DN4602_c1_g1_i7.p6 TRINITY_DN4602_c1_g1~~TRINITY_DN4602_c1_g1_i7.p6  ORF type:complete len:105 (-),score=2.65 TRINITY_DN4602_c1_g1_i7:94-408(-)